MSSTLACLTTSASLSCAPARRVRSSRASSSAGHKKTKTSSSSSAKSAVRLPAVERFRIGLHVRTAATGDAQGETEKEENKAPDGLIDRNNLDEQYYRGFFESEIGEEDNASGRDKLTASLKLGVRRWIRFCFFGTKVSQYVTSVLLQRYTGPFGCSSNAVLCSRVHHRWFLLNNHMSRGRACVCVCVCVLPLFEPSLNPL